jgi:prepilin-type processing-associated H-X9-DG protein
MSKVIQPGLIVDSAYGINGDVYGSVGAAVNADPNPGYVDGEVQGGPGNPYSGFDYNANTPCRAISWNNTEKCDPLHKFTNFKRSSLTVLLFDGTEWNGMISGAEWRISGARHGNFNANPPTSMQRGNPSYTLINVTGTTNLLFMDGHVDNVPRAQCPAWGYEWVGFRAEMVPGTEYIWNTNQQY